MVRLPKLDTSFVWKKGTEKSRYKLFGKITALLEQINESLAAMGVCAETNTEYSPESLELIASRYPVLQHMNRSRQLPLSSFLTAPFSLFSTSTNSLLHCFGA